MCMIRPVKRFEMRWKKPTSGKKLEECLSIIFIHMKNTCLSVPQVSVACMMGLKSNQDRLGQSGFCLLFTSLHRAGCFLFSVLCSLA